MVSVTQKPPLEIRAGRTALKKIRESGLAPDDIHSVYGASGAAKWLAIAGLDAAIFADWLPAASAPIAVFGTSIGAIKLAAALQPNPRQQLDTLARAYIDQSYSGPPTAAAIATEMEKILALTLGEQGVEAILNNRRLRFHCGAVAGRGLFNSASRGGQVLAMLGLSSRCLKQRNALVSELERVVFYVDVPASVTGTTNDSSVSLIEGRDAFCTRRLALDSTNLRAAIFASGSIPVYMNGIPVSVPLAGQASTEHRQTLMLRDGGLLDYHPVPSNLQASVPGKFVLYPHFYSELRETWFDKFYRWRKVEASRLDDVILVSPSADYIASLKQQRIPDRSDFTRYAGRDASRVALWTDAMLRSHALGDYWLELCEKQDWSEVMPI